MSLLNWLLTKQLSIWGRAENQITAGLEYLLHGNSQIINLEIFENIENMDNIFP